jgi:hypothetical protein
MTTALCTACGAMKFGAWLECKACGMNSTGNRNFDIFMSDHYLDERALSFLAGVATKIRGVAADPHSAQQLFLYYAVQTLPGLGRVDIEPEHKVRVDRALGAAAIPALPSDIVFRFDETLEKRAKRPRWKFWK